MKTDMATRSSSAGWKIGERSTEFQLHKSQLPASNVKKVLDYTEHRLRIFLQRILDPQQKQTLNEVIKKYCKGEVAVAWKAGKPVWINVTKD